MDLTLNRNISTVIADPEKFGLTIEEIRASYAMHGERIGVEGVARHPKNRSHDERGFPRLRDLGIDANKRSRWQAISEIPEEAFEDYVQTTKLKEDELTRQGSY